MSEIIQAENLIAILLGVIIGVPLLAAWALFWFMLFYKKGWYDEA